MKKSLIVLIFSLACVATSASAAKPKQKLQSPAPGVVCDKYLCVDAGGVSIPLTEKFLGKKSSQKLISQGEFDHSEFTFANGIFCDVKEKLCRQDRYYGADGKRSGVIDQETTKLVFGQKIEAS